MSLAELITLHLSSTEQITITMGEIKNVWHLILPRRSISFSTCALESPYRSGIMDYQWLIIVEEDRIIYQLLMNCVMGFLQEHFIYHWYLECLDTWYHMTSGNSFQVKDAARWRSNSGSIATHSFRLDIVITTRQIPALRSLRHQAVSTRWTGWLRRCLYTLIYGISLRILRSR